MKLKKVVFTSLVTLLLSVPTAEVVSNSVQAAEVTSSSTQTASDSSTQTFQVPTNGISFQNEQSLNESKIGWGKGAKVAVKAVLKNRNKLVSAVGKVAGRKAAVEVGNVLNKVTPTLRKLSRWENLSFKAVQDQIASALIASHVNPSTARTLAYWIRLGLELLV